MSRLSALAFGLFISASLTGAGSEPEKPQTLPAVVVEENPFGRFGFDAVAYFGLLGRITGGAPRSHWLVFQVDAGSPAHRAGLAVGDEIIAINGLEFSQLPRRRLRETLVESNAGSEIQLDVYDGRAKVRRQIRLRSDSGRKWLSGEQRTLVIWGLLVTIDEPRKLKSGLNAYPPKATFIWKDPRTCRIDLGETHFEFIEIKTDDVTIQSNGRDAGTFSPGTHLRLLADGRLQSLGRAEGVGP